MELLQAQRNIEVPVESSSSFITSNTTSIGYADLKRSSIIPVFSKDNESTISHTELIDLLMEVTHAQFPQESIGNPSIIVSHPIKGRIPSAIGKPADQLQEHEKTIYYERMAFMVEIPSVRDTINGNSLALSIGGVRAYNLDNLRGKKAAEKFKLFIGFMNKVCTNLCVWTDGYKAEVKVMTLHDLYEQAAEMVQSFDMDRQLSVMRNLPERSLTEKQFAQLIGRARMYQFIPANQQKSLPQFPLSDTQISSVVKEYYNSDSFCRRSNGEIDLWRLYNLFTGANKSSYIDTFLDRSVSCTDFIRLLTASIEDNTPSWYLV